MIGITTTWDYDFRNCSNFWILLKKVQYYSREYKKMITWESTTTKYFNKIDWLIESPPLTWGVGSVTNFITYINVITKINLKRNKKPWRAHCKISYHHIIYFTNTTKVNCNVWKWKMSNWQMNQICLMRAYTRWNLKQKLSAHIRIFKKRLR